MSYQNIISVGDTMLDYKRGIVKRDGQSAKLTPKETRLLYILMKNAGQTVSRLDLIKGVWHQDHLKNQTNLDVHIHWLRLKVEPNPHIPELIITRRGQGYEFLT